ncbi:hypothetical protein JB92DRAFT_3120535 [Gautieria morchelliformis]|nr:hypothetical protein JB92DRAFT_3120535 [Gautieria morchelliformis]
MPFTPTLTGYGTIDHPTIHPSVMQYLHNPVTLMLLNITKTIKCVTSNGIETAHGKHRGLDTPVCATGVLNPCTRGSHAHLFAYRGFDTTWKPPATFGRDGLKLQEKCSGYPLAYLDIVIDGFPK